MKGLRQEVTHQLLDTSYIEVNKTYSYIKKFPKGGWVCWETSTAVPLSVLLLSFQGYPRCHLR